VRSLPEDCLSEFSCLCMLVCFFVEVLFFLVFSFSFLGEGPSFFPFWWLVDVRLSHHSHCLCPCADPTSTTLFKDSYLSIYPRTTSNGPSPIYLWFFLPSLPEPLLLFLVSLFYFPSLLHKFMGNCLILCAPKYFRSKPTFGYPSSQVLGAPSHGLPF